MQKRRRISSLLKKRKEHYTKKRLFSLFLLLFFLCMLSTATAQNRVFLTLKNEPMAKALDKVASAAGMKINFSTEDVKGYQVSLNVQNGWIEDVLDQMIGDKPFRYSISGEFITVTRTRPRIASDMRTMTGEVIASDASPLSGAHIIVTDVQGKQVEMLSADVNGKYILKLSFGKTYFVKARFVGMKEKTVKIKPNTDEIPIIVLEEDNKIIGEVVVTGYGNILKGNYTGAATTIKAADILMPGLSSIDQMLQGVVPGMLVSNTTGQVGASSKVRVRGTSTLLGSQEPVWVVDGVIQRDPQPFNSDNNTNFSMEGDDIKQLAGNAISWLNPNDIESITVLKDASATAIYGSKAANGVIVIKTKKANEQRISVNYNGSVSIGQRPRYSMYDRMNSAQGMQLSKDIYDEHRKYNTQILPIGYAGLVQQLTNKEITLEQMNQSYRKMAMQNTDWFDLLFRNSVNHSHSVSISGGSQRIMNRTSLGYTEENGDAKGNDMKSFTATSSTQVSFSPNFRAAILLHGSMRKVNGFAYGVNPWNYAYNTSRVIPVYEDGGELYYHGKKGAGSYAIPSKSVYNYNILNELANTGSSNNTRTWDATIDLNWRIIPGLEYQGLFSYASSSSDSKQFASENSNYIAQVRGYEVGEVMANSAEMKLSPLPFGGLLETDLSNTTSITARNSLVYDRIFKLKHRTTFQLGTETSSTKMKGNTNKRYGYLPDRGETFATPPAVYGSNKLDNSAIAQGTATVINRVENELSGYGLAVYTYDDRYVVNLNARFDASNRFSQERNNTFEPTWSAGLKWRAANESFVRDIKWINNLDLYGSYGFQGNAVPSVSPYLIASEGGLNHLYQAYVLNVKNLPYPELGWEKTKTWNIGVDASLLNGRLNLAFNYFRKLSNVLASRNIPIENGVSNGIVSGTQMKNYGYDLVVDVVPVRTENFTWQLSFNTSITKNSVQKNQRINTVSDYLSGSCIVEGRPFSTFYSYEFDKLDPKDGKPLFKNLDITKGENALDFLVESGKYTPDFSGGINTMLKYKRLSLYALFSIQWGGSSRLPDLFPGASVYVNGLPMPESNASTKLIGRWRKPGDEVHTNIPSLPGLGNELITLPATATDTPTRANLYELYNYSDLRVAKTDFIRCRSISLTYELNENWLKRFSIRRMLVKASMTNPFVIAFDKKWDGLDPETGDWPARRVTSLSLQVMF